MPQFRPPAPPTPRLQRARACFASLALVLALASPPAPVAASPRPLEPLDGGEIAHALRRLQVVGSALYVAAHPDDENTALLAWLTHVKGVRTAYLSMTRGDGGQNLIGQELGPALGVIRTQELLAARRMDGAEQLFTRALDFGYSKRADEALAFWEHDSVLADVVWAIRRFRPDIVVTRFPPDSTAGHGHHTASSVLAGEAFAAAADPARYPEQLDRAAPWQAKRLFWNAFTGRVAVDSSWLVVDVGDYEPRLGRSMSELAGLSRSNHKSQGFGAPERRGSLLNHLALRAGPPAKRDPFEGVDLSWKRFRGGEAVAALLAQAERAFDVRRPERVLPTLARAHAAMRNLPGDPLIARRLLELERVMASCAGLWLEADSLRPSVTPGEEVTIAASALARRPAAVSLESVSVDGQSRSVPRALVPNRAAADTLRFTPARELAITQPYWLTLPAGRGLARVADRADLGNPESRPALAARFRVAFAGEPVDFELPVAHRWTDPVQGERWRLLEVAPPATLAFDRTFQLFNGGGAPRPVRVTVRANRANVSGSLRLEVPAGWSVRPERAPVAIERAGGEQSFELTVTPGPLGGTARAVIEVDGRPWSFAEQKIDHEHIPVQKLHQPAELKLVRAELVLRATRVGYLAGSGDQLADALRQMGCAVTELSDDDVANGDLAGYDAIVTGVRAYNTRPRLRSLQPRLLDWVAAGGTLVVQYVTTSDGPVDYLGPKPMRLGRERVSVEDAPITFLKPGHPLLTTPNAIGPADFEGWVQERGLYFATSWDSAYDAVLGSRDPGEPSRDGGLVYERHGKGSFVYCGYALFRQVPAGVPGAWRLLANLVSAP
jgi:LmbE family N-acetylglucosaminyl deacetylase